MKLLLKKADELYPGKGIHHMITKETIKWLKESGIDRSKLCDDLPEEEIKHTVIKYELPNNLVKPIECVCKKKSLPFASFILRYILQPHLDK